MGIKFRGLMHYNQPNLWVLIVVMLHTLHSRVILYSAKFWRGEYFGGFARNCQKFTLQIPTLNSNANFATAQPPKYHHPNMFSSFIHQKFAPLKFFHYMVLGTIHVFALFD